MRTREVGKGITFSSISCRHSSRIMYLLECVYVESLHVHLGGSNPCRIIQIAHPVDGTLFQVQGVFEKTALIRGRFEKKADMWLWYLFCITCIRIFIFNICLY